MARDIPRSDVTDIVSFIGNIPYSETLVNLDRITVKPSDAERVEKMLSDNVPTAYITGRKEFYGREFSVNKDVLIPRPETESLVNTVISAAGKNAGLKILDLCTGSGCILLTLLKELPDSCGVGVDISSEALDVARGNASKLGVADKAEFLERDVLNEFMLPGFDIITVNPPYLSLREYENAPHSLLFEPRVALTAGEDGNVFYKKLLCTVDKLGNNNALAFFEVGYTQSAKVLEIAASHGYNWRAVKDAAGYERVVWGKVNKNV
ncbi:MAG: peptide chain release factor N(5)-glutamine methyltransferase [Deferribacteraceae bacterium]|nr:peptide chain release factor N(5)-glutamine methyltransferase [Deferribacteraceae bacterium]